MTYPFDPKKYPNCTGAIDYALAVLDEIIPTSIYTFAACERFMEDLERTDEFDLRWDKAERFMRLFQRFHHVIGEWDTPNIMLEGWQKFFFTNAELFYWKHNGKRRYKAAHLEVARGNGKAKPLDTRIPTPSGMVAMGDLHVGDQVYGRDGKVCNIIGETEVHTPDQYKITFANGLELLSSSNHEWFTTNSTERNRKKRHTKRPPVKRQGNMSFVYESVKTTKEIFETQVFSGRKDSNHHIALTKPIEGTPQQLAVDPWVLGYWLGNGHSKGNAITCDSKDAEYLLSCVRSAGHETSVRYETKSNAATLKPLGLCTLLKEVGVFGDKHIPQQYLAAPIEDRLELLRGLLDSDGSISSREGSGVVEFCSVKEDLARQVHRLICGLGFKAQVRKYKITSNVKTTNEFHWDVTFTPLVEYPLFKLKRKRELQKLPASFTSTDKQVIRKVEPVAVDDRVPMKCIEVDSCDNSYLVTDYHIPTHNSAVASCTGLIYLNLVEIVKGNKVYSCATKKEQARIVLDSSREMAKANRSYLQKTGAEVFAHHIAHEESGSEFRALSSDSKSLDGLQPVLAIIDELHAHKDRAVYDVIDSAMSKRRDSFMLIITTAGFSLEGIGYSQSQYAKKVALGEIDDDSFFSLVYTLDEDDDWKDPENWLKANPNWGVSVDPDSFKSKALKAMANPVDEINFKVKHLNLWQNAMSQYFSVKLWDKLGNPSLTLEKFRGQKCFVGIDLASKVDLTAIAYIFKDEKTGKYSIITKSYCPEGTIQTSKNNSYVGWVSEGHLIQTNGQAINYPKLRKDFLQDVRTVKAQEIAYDPWNATEFSQELANERLEMVEYRMNTANFSEPMKRLEALIREGMIEHDGNPLVSWCLGNVVAKPDANDNVFPRKDHESLKIDVIIAILEALGLWIQYEEQTSVYEKRELRIL